MNTKPQSLDSTRLLAQCPWLAPASAADVAPQLGQYQDEIRRYAPKVNLISLADLPQFTTRHVIPALSLAAQILLHPHARIMDVGSGAGLPGIPLACVLCDSQFALVEPRRRRANFLRHCSRVLGLQNVTVYNERVEDMTEPPFDLILSRAVGGMHQLQQGAMDCLRPHGVFLTTQAATKTDLSVDHTYKRRPGREHAIIVTHRATCGQ